MKNALSILVIACLFCITSCIEKKEKEPSRMKMVMSIHDEVMPKMGTIGKLVGKLKPMADSLGPESKEAKAMKDLQQAYESMMVWMQDLGNRFEPDEIMNGKELTKEKQKWLKEEEVKIKKVKEAINSSIENAQRILKD